VRHAPAEVADAFCATRLGRGWDSFRARARRDLLLPRLKRLRPPGRESRGRAERRGSRRRRDRGRQEPVRRRRGRNARLLEAARGPVPGRWGGPGADRGAACVDRAPG
jgi:hypothetical protein